MALPGVPQTFAIENAQEMTDKLYWEIEKYRNEQDLEKKLWRGFNCAMTAWHICDWFWREHGGRQSIFKFQKKALKDCPSLLLCKYIANASKHSGVDKHPNDAIQVVVRGRDSMLTDWPQAILESKKSDHWEIMIIVPQGETDAYKVFLEVQQYWDTRNRGLKN